MYALTNCILHTGSQTVSDRALLIESDRIQAVIPAADLAAPPARSEAIALDTILDLGGCQVAPGLIDLQLNGCGGVMFNDTITAETLDIMHQTNLKSGTTSYLPTLITTSDADMAAAMAVVQDYRRQHPYRVLGLHLEGPYLNPLRRGIHNAAFVRPPDRSMLEQIAAAGPEVVRLMTLAPEQVEPEQIRLLADRGIIVSAGHSQATYEQAMAGFEAGVRMVTHLFNAMSPWTSRQPGLVGAAFNRPEVYAGIIADGHHTHWASVQLAYRLKGDRLILVSDATPPVGTQMASFQIGGQEVFYHEGKCVSADGTLGGSALTLMAAVANCVEIGIPLAEALRMASTYPATLLGLETDLGYLRAGFVANLAIFDENYRLVAIVDRGHYHPLTR